MTTLLRSNLGATMALVASMVIASAIWIATYSVLLDPDQPDNINFIAFR